jgi:hypothetical protein
MVALFCGEKYQLLNDDGKVVWVEEPVKILQSEFDTFPLDDHTRQRIDEQLKEQLPTPSTAVARRPSKPRQSKSTKRSFPVMSLQTAHHQKASLLSIPSLSTASSSVSSTPAHHDIFASLANVEFDPMAPIVPIDHLLTHVGSTDDDMVNNMQFAKRQKVITYVPSTSLKPFVYPTIPALPTATPPPPPVHMEVDSGAPDPVLDRLRALIDD